jgi:hypothetical protein
MGLLARITQMGRTATFEALEGRLSALQRLSSHAEHWLSEIEAELEWLSLLVGQTLFRGRSVADARSFVLARCPSDAAGNSGRDVSIANGGTGGTGEMVGEMALVGGGLRSATIAALRNTELLATVNGEVMAIAIRAQADIIFKFRLPLEAINLLDRAIAAGRLPSDREAGAHSHIGVAGASRIVPRPVATITAIRGRLA